MSGEYFLTEKMKEEKQNEKKREQKAQRKQDKIDTKNKQLIAPDEDKKITEKPVFNVAVKPDINELKKKFLKKK